MRFNVAIILRAAGAVKLSASPKFSTESWRVRIENSELKSFK